MPMCIPSSVAEDWVKKGFHLHIGKVEIRVISNHRGELDFRPAFANISDEDFWEAVAIIKSKCLPDEHERKRWFGSLARARVLMLRFKDEGAMRRKANGHMLEFKFLRIALESWIEKNV